MSEDLPIYSETPLRTGLQFADLERLKGADTSAVWVQADARIAALEGRIRSSRARARESESAFTKEASCTLTPCLFPDRAERGQMEAERTRSLSIEDRIAHRRNSSSGLSTI